MRINSPLSEAEERPIGRAIQREQKCWDENYISMFLSLQEQRQLLWDRLDKANEEIYRLRILLLEKLD